MNLITLNKISDVVMVICSSVPTVQL